MTVKTAKVFPVEQAPPGPNPAKDPLAYGSRGIPKLLEEIVRSSSDVSQKQNAITTLVSLLHAPEGIALALKHGLIQQLIPLLSVTAPEQKKNVVMVQRSLDLYEILSKHALGRSALITQKTIPLLASLFLEEDEYARRKVYMILANLVNGFHVPQLERNAAAVQSGVEAILSEQGLIRLLLSRVQQERFENQATILQILYAVLRTSVPLRQLKQGEEGYTLQKKMAVLRTDSVFHLNSLEVFLELVHPQQPSQIKELAAQCLAALFHNESVEIMTDPIVTKLSEEVAQSTEDVEAETLTKETGSIDPLLLEESISLSTDPITAKEALPSKSTSITAQARSILKPEEDSFAPTTCRQKAIREGAIVALLLLLKSDATTGGQRTPVQAAAMQAIMALSIDVEAKKQYVREAGVPVLAETLRRCVDDLYERPLKDLQLESEVARLLLFTMKTMANIAEEYRARFALQQSIPVLQRVIYMTTDPILATAAKQAIKVISWRP